MNYEEQSLKVTQEITYPNTGSDSLNDIVLAVEPNRLDSVFALQSVSVNGQAISSYTLDGQQLDVTLPAPLAAGDSLKLSLDYTLNMPDIVQGDPNVIRPQIFGVANRQVNLVDWYPFIVPHNADGWVLHKPWYYGEHLVYPLADFDVTLRFTDEANLPIVAASAAPEVVSGGTRYRLEKARNFSFSMGRQFRVLNQQVGDVTVYSYYLDDINQPPAQAALDATVKAMQTYTDLFGPYPHQTLSVIQGDFNDGMEFDGLYFLSRSFYNLYDGTEKTYLVMVAAHETSHQWWFGRVGNDQAQEPWLDESLAMYCEKLFYEKNYPDDLKWWWSYRVDFYQPTGLVDTVLYDGGGFTPYTNATYRMGARFLEDLRQQIGDEAFFAFLKDYATQMDGKTSTSADFFRILRMHTDVDFSGLVEKYFQKGH
jgi:aminopeptidase N